VSGLHGLVATKGRSPAVVGLRRDEVANTASEVIKAMAVPNSNFAANPLRRYSSSKPRR